MPTASPLFLVTNCSATKRIAAGEPVLLRNWSGSVRQRFHRWKKAIEKQVPGMTVRDCYAGDSWSQVVAAEKASPTTNCLWVISAGLGLLPAHQTIPSYSATFVNNELDSVGPDLSEKTEWWNMLVEWRRELTGIGCITDLAMKNPESVFIVAVSSTYLSVIIKDLVSAQGVLISPDNLVIISSGTRQIPALGSSLLPIDARFENLVGGARATLNARMLRHIVEKYKSQKISASQVSKYLLSLTPLLAQPRLAEIGNADLVDGDSAFVGLILDVFHLVMRESARFFRGMISTVLPFFRTTMGTPIRRCLSAAFSTPLLMESRMMDSLLWGVFIVR